MTSIKSELDLVFGVDTQVNLHPPQAELLQITPPLQELGNDEAGLVSSRPSIQVLPVDDSFPLTHYYISSSHNTYLLSRQLVGKSTAESYRHILQRHGRCVEIDAWQAKKDNPDEPVVTHGYTLSKSVGFRAVCREISATVDPHDWPTMISLECHVGLKGQDDLVRIMKEEFGSKLVDQKLDDIDDDEICPKDLKGRVVCMVEYYPSLMPDDDAPSSSSSSDSDGSEAAPPRAMTITPALASIGHYARSLKPTHRQWFSLPSIFMPPTHPSHVLINISESKVHAYPLEALWTHAKHHLRRVFPKGTRIGSSNMDVVKCWRNGSQVVSVNWQEYDRGMHINEAMFVGTDGWVHKPPFPQERRTVTLGLTIAGISSVPLKTLDEHIYARVRLIHADGDQKFKTKSVRPTTYENGVSGVMWNESVAWTVNYDELAFIHVVVQEDEFGRDDKVAVFCARVANLSEGWRPWRMLDMAGKWKGTWMMVKWTVTDT